MKKHLGQDTLLLHTNRPPRPKAQGPRAQGPSSEGSKPSSSVSISTLLPLHPLWNLINPSSLNRRGFQSSIFSTNGWTGQPEPHSCCKEAMLWSPNCLPFLLACLHLPQIRSSSLWSDFQSHSSWFWYSQFQSPMSAEFEVGLGFLVSKILIFVQFYMHVKGNDCCFDSGKLLWMVGFRVQKWLSFWFLVYFWWMQLIDQIVGLCHFSASRSVRFWRKIRKENAET